MEYFVIMLLDACEEGYPELGWYVADDQPPTQDRDQASQYQTRQSARSDAKAIERTYTFHKVRTRVGVRRD